MHGGSEASARRALRRSVLGLFLLGTTAGVISPAAAETLFEALAAAYATNPTLNAQRAALRATDEEVPRAKSGFRPFILGDADVNKRWSRTDRVGVPPTTDSTLSRGYSVTLDQNIFNGFEDVNAVREAQANVHAGREQLRGVEQLVLLDAVTAYVDVLRDQAIVRLQQNNLNVLSEQLKATQDRFDVGEVTRTDVAQAEASRAASLSALQLAQANLKASRAFYQRIIGHAPSGLSDPPRPNGQLPSTLDDSLSISDSENPNILAAAFAEEAAGYALKRIMGELLPEVSLEATYSDRWDPSEEIERQQSASILGRLIVPFYQGGEVAARVRQAKDVNLQRRRELDEARTVIHAEVVSTWGRFEAAKAQLESDQTAVRASRIALTGVREEEKVGQRTVLDVLQAEQTLLDAEVALETTRRDLIVAGYALLAAVGRLDAIALGLPVQPYDPTDHYYRVKNKWWGLNAEPLPLLEGQPFVLPPPDTWK